MRRTAGAVSVSATLYSALRPLLFSLSTERAHAVTLGALDLAQALGLARLAAPAPFADERHVMGLRFSNAVGLAAGLDKDGAHIDALAGLGFGFIEVGTVTPRPQAGNPRPRLFRVPERAALINRMGFNNGGLDAFLANVKRARYRGVLGLNIGKNADTPIERAQDDYLSCLRGVYPHASYVTVNISSPNTKNLRDLQSSDALDALLAALKTEQARLADQHGRYVPLALKIAPDLDEAQIGAIAVALTRHRIDAVIATNTTIARDGVDDLAVASQAGGLSGAPLGQRALSVTAALARALDGALPIIGVGGISSASDAVARQRAGASLIQLYTGLIYRGPTLINECAYALSGRCPV
jgi:dihydroorotate dehydrogenase